MGNCMLKRLSGDGIAGGGGMVEDMVKVVTSNGGVMELYAPITAACITGEFPGHALFLSPKPLSTPLLNDHRLRPGQFYYLLPTTAVAGAEFQHEGKTTPYRMSSAESTNSSMSLKRSSENSGFDKFPRWRRGGAGAGDVWKVRLVITPDELSEILAHETRTQALIENVRAVAKCSAMAPPPECHRSRRSSARRINCG